MRLFITVIILLCSFISMAQHQADVWYFGKKAGLSFKSGEPEALTDSKLGTVEGVASICDTAGNLLFYTDGVTVFNKDHKIIENGFALKGHPSSTQSGVVIAMPKNDTLYYLFTIADEGKPNGFCYSIVNVKGDSGRCSLIKKNIFLASPVTEKITGVTHRNNTDFWVLTHLWNSDVFLSYKLTKNGLDTNCIRSKIGTPHDGIIDNTIGYMKASPDGTQIAVAIKNKDIVELFDFDDSTGVLSNALTIQLPEGSLPYGIEFAPNGSLLYISAGKSKRVYQYNLQAGSPELILKSQFLVGESEFWLGALQLAKDQRIYLSPHMSEYLSVINFPDSVGAACGYENNKIFLKGNKSALGFPTFLQSYFIKKSFSDSTIKYFSANEKIEMGKPLILNNILFETAKSTLLPKSYVELNKLLDILIKNPNYIITISGHTDNVGNKSYNLNLSQNRAKSVANYLISKGIAADRITTFGYGNGQPIASNENPEGRQLNRRVEFIMNMR